MPGSGKAGVNPEQLFAMGYAACFDNALPVAAKQLGLHPEGSRTSVEVGIGQTEAGGYALDIDLYVEVMKKRAPDAEWCAAGIGPAQAVVNEWAIAAGGHTRAGLEDNVRLDRDRLAPSNAALIARAADLCAKYGRPVATPAEARRILGLKAA